MDNISILNFIIIGITTTFSIGLFIISLNSYRKSRKKKILFVSFLLMLFFIKSLLFSLFLFTEQIQNDIIVFVLEIFDLLILVFLYTAVLIKQ